MPCEAAIQFFPGSEDLHDDKDLNSTVDSEIATTTTSSVLMQNNERFAHQVQVSILFVETAINSDLCRIINCKTSHHKYQSVTAKMAKVHQRPLYISKTYQSMTLGPSSY
jgi:hypothetical protein